MNSSGCLRGRGAGAGSWPESGRARVACPAAGVTTGAGAGGWPGNGSGRGIGGGATGVDWEGRLGRLPGLQQPGSSRSEESEDVSEAESEGEESEAI